MKSWSMIRSAPAAANRWTIARAAASVPYDPSVAALLEPGLAAFGVLSERLEHRRLPFTDLGVGPPDEDPGHDRAGDRRGVSAGRLAGRVELRVGLRHQVRARRERVELVRVRGHQPQSARRARSAVDHVRPRGTVATDGSARDRDGLRVEDRLLDGQRPSLVRPAVRLAPQAVEHGQLVFDGVHALAERRERQSELAMLELVPPGPDADLDTTTAHLVRGRDDLGEGARVPERHGRHERAETDPVRLPGQARDDGPGVRRGLVGPAREAGVVVGPEEGLEPVGLSALGDGDLLPVGQTLLRLDHQHEPHDVSCMVSGPFTLTRWSARL